MDRLGYWDIADAHSVRGLDGDPMTEHLPECLDKDECEYDANGKCWVKHHPCICDELRACEQRVMDAACDVIKLKKDYYTVLASTADEDSFVRKLWTAYAETHAADILLIDALREE